MVIKHFEIQLIKSVNNFYEKKKTPNINTVMYVVAKYYALVYTRNANCHKINTELNRGMRIISETVRPTQIQWLPTIGRIIPPDLRRLQHTKRIHSLKIINYSELPLYTLTSQNTSQKY